MKYADMVIGLLTAQADVAERDLDDDESAELFNAVLEGFQIEVTVDPDTMRSVGSSNIEPILGAFLSVSSYLLARLAEAESKEPQEILQELALQVSDDE
ncbi:MAG TPA: hypothetical protein VHU91_06320 [Mycobacteriales bacterium]|jgi:hypothetical protein|nr:hypothetical protein [Mycobacteriales bacterium]